MAWPINTVNVQYIGQVTILYMNVDMYNVDISLNCRWMEEKTIVTADRSGHVGWTDANIVLYVRQWENKSQFEAPLQSALT